MNFYNIDKLRGELKRLSCSSLINSVDCSMLNRVTLHLDNYVAAIKALDRYAMSEAETKIVADAQKAVPYV